MMVQFLAQVNSETSNSVDLFTNGIKNFGYIIATDDIPKAIDRLWRVVMDGRMYSIVCGLGLTLAVFAIGFWCVKFYKTIEEGGLRPAVNELVMPVVLVILLSNNGYNMRNMTVGTRDLMNAVNRTVTGAVTSEVELKNAIQTIAGYGFIKGWIEQGANNCRSLVNSAEIEGCLDRNIIKAEVIKAIMPGANSNTPSYYDRAKSETNATVNKTKNPDSVWSEEVPSWNQTMEKWVESAIASRNQAAKATSTDDLKKAATQKVDPKNGTVLPTTDKTAVTGSNSKDAFNIGSVTDFSSSRAIRETILSMRGAFIYIIEVMMLVTGLVGPIFVALALFPSGANHLIKWGASFISLGFCKLCYSLISGLSALAMVYAGPENVDMLVASLILGLFAPVLAFGIASGSGIGILNTISYSSSTFGVNLGLSSYNPAMGDGGKNNQTPATTKSENQSGF